MKRYIFFYWYAIIFVPNVISLSAQRKAPFWKWSNLSNCIFWWGFNKVTAAHQVTSNTLGLKSLHTFTGSTYIYLGYKDIWAQLYNNFLKAVHFVQCSCFLWSSSSNFEASFSNYFIDPYQRDQKCNYFNYKFSSLQFWPNQFEGKKLSKGKKTLIISISNGSGNLIINCILNQSCQLCLFLISTFFHPSKIANKR